MKKYSIPKISLFIAFILFSIPVQSVKAQSVADIMDQMFVKHSNALDGIETMMTISKSDGFLQSDVPDTIYYQKITLADGTNILEPISTDTQSGTAYFGNFTRGYDALVENSRYEGIETIDGKRAHAIFIEDLSALQGSMGTPTGMPEGQGGEVQSGWFYVDANDLVPIKMTFDLMFDADYEGSMDMSFRDYRSVNGVPMAYEVEMIIDGISESVSAEDMAEARNNIQQLREQLDGASGLQKRIMERVVTPQLERLEKILEDGNMNMKITIIEAEANGAIPEQEISSN